MKEFTVESESWYKNVKLPNNKETPNLAAEAATQAVNSFFEGDVKIRSYKKPMSMSPAILVREKNDKGIHLFYTPRILANAGWHDEATSFHKRIINHNYKTAV
tara:strand:- start:1466 stop:1774 length:309 start_codon:yes stop_codon:yes gene_type:complete